MTPNYLKFYEKQVKRLRKVSLKGKKRSKHHRRFETLVWTLNRYSEEINSGICLEFGVYVGKSANIIADYVPFLYGFDSFTGFPDDGRDDWQYDFNLNGKLPKVPNNVKLIDGFFEDTLPPFMNKLDGEITFMHIDCDLYSSTQTVLKNTEDRLADGCIIVFDELINYHGFENNEWKAFVECLERKRFRIEWLCTYNKVMDWAIYKKLGKFSTIDAKRKGYCARASVRIWKQD